MKFYPNHLARSCLINESAVFSSQDGQTEETVYSKQKGLRLVLFSVDMDDSGKYVCTASDQHKTLRTSVNLAVWPAGKLEFANNLWQEEH